VKKCAEATILFATARLLPVVFVVFMYVTSYWYANDIKNVNSKSVLSLGNSLYQGFPVYVE
jgi:uncharacterized membrane protein YjfL (UPF0719 family)